MKIVNLTERKFREFANSYSKNNFGQATEYAKIITNRHKRSLFLGLIDDNYEIKAGALILIRNVSKLVKEAVAPNGYLIDYHDFDLVSTFTTLLKERLLKEGVTYLITNPMFKYHVYNKSNQMIENNDDIYNNLLNLEYHSIGYFSEFENYDIIIDNIDTLEDIYHNFSRNIKRKITEASSLGITIHKGSLSNLEAFYEIIKKKSTKKLSFYESILRTYNDSDNQANLYFTIINPHNYLIRIKGKFEKEKTFNEKVHKRFNNHRGKITNHMLNYKMEADKRFERWKNELDYAINLNTKYNNDIILGTSLVISNNHELYFLVDGYKEEFRHFYSNDILKWALIREYYTKGYRTFNLGEIHNTYHDKTSKYYYQYRHKIGFGGNIVEYTPNLIYIINKPVYKMHQKWQQRHK